MPTQFMSLTNTLLRRLNEVEIEQADFAAARGVQALAKDAINASIAEINNQQFEWSFNATSGEQELTAGTNLYNFPADCKKVDYHSFRIEKDDALNVNSKRLRFINKDDWERWFKDNDLNAAADGVSVPDYVFKGNGFQFGVTPSPNEAYTVTFDYFMVFTALSDYDDTPTIPSNWDEVIIQGALQHFYMFRDNDTQAQIAKKTFSDMLRPMVTVLGNLHDETMASTMLVPVNWAYSPTFTGAAGS